MNTVYAMISLFLLLAPTPTIHTILPEIPNDASEYFAEQKPIKPTHTPYTPKKRTSYQQQRYEKIKKIATKYKRPITILDIGAMQGGYYTFNLAHDFGDAVCVMIEQDAYLQRLCLQNNTLNNIIFLQTPINSHELKHLSECEHFDIVLALNVIHWAHDTWQEMADAILQLGDRIIIETPSSPNNTLSHEYFADIEKYLQAHGGKQILQIPHQIDSTVTTHMYVITHNKNTLKRANWFDKPHSEYTIKPSLRVRRSRRAATRVPDE